MTHNNSNNFNQENAYIQAQKRLKDLKGFYWHAFFYVLINLFLLVMIAINSGDNFWHIGTFSTPFFWGIGLAAHAMGVFGKNLIFSKNWENRKIQEYINKDKTRWE
ncbi:2TM domain-containing protein [Algibacter miyuki]|uniref:2TM domain-containing protein n=1 Tax=Algibacter miyuki TaxID=1306933 RepID=A0ABV5H2B4_9FLAO|nr:2TM domain-containing protein [Algibacter miyuki]MDN3666540.1 2TM domain-containing protein [Algibacter miyuki]